MKLIYEFLECSAKKFPEKEAVVVGSQRITYAELNRLADKVQTFLNQNYQKQEVISLFLGNSLEFLVAYFGILKAGCIAHIIPPNISKDNFNLQLQEVEPKLIFTTTELNEKLEKKIPLVHPLKIGKKTEERQINKPEINPEDFSTIIYSSGTTSRPKGVKLKHSNVVAATENMLEILKIREEDIYLNVLPLSHSFGLGNVHMMFKQGGMIIIEKNALNTPQFLQKIKKEKATVFAAAPATFRLILDTAKELFTECKQLHLMITNSTAMPKETTLEIFNCLPETQFYMYYGLTEASRSTFIHYNFNLNKLESVGPAAPNVKLKIINEEGSELQPLQKGEICIRGKHVIQEYWKNEEASKAIKEGWIQTGDYGYLDEEGFLYLIGRNDDLINVAGEKVSPLEIEKICLDLEGIKEAAAIGVPHHFLSQVVNLCVIKDKSKKDISEQEIIAHARHKLEGYKVPRKIIFVEEIPKTDSGKIKRNLLKSALGDVLPD